MPQPQRQTLRLRADETSRAPLLDAYNNITPQAWARAATQFEIALASGGALDNIGNLASVTLEAAPYATRTGARALSKTLASAALDNTLSEATWADGSHQHALFSFSSAEMNVSLGAAASVDLWLVISAITVAGDPIVYGTGKLTISDPGTFNSAPPPPANPGAGITLDQADARYLPVSARIYRPQITALTGHTFAADGVTPTSLDAIATLPATPGALALGSRVDILLPSGTPDRARSFYLLARSGATPDNTTVIEPHDYDPAINDVAFFRF